jgi:nuclear pore complex protein Nup205
MVLHWSTAPFQALYDAISQNVIDSKQNLITELSDDLISLLIVKEKSDASRKVLESGELKFNDGSIYKVNKAFIENSIIISDQLNIDELIAAELLYFASSNEQINLSTSILDAAIAAYYNRKNYILQILSYYLCLNDENENKSKIKNKKDNLVIKNSPTTKEFLLSEISKTQNFLKFKILESFKSIEKELKLIKESVERSKILGSFHEHSPEIKVINFRRNTLFKQYQSLGEILLGYVNTFLESEHEFTTENFFDILNHISTLKPEDIFSLCFLPSLFYYVSKLYVLPNSDVEILHSKIINHINIIEKLSENPFKSLVFLAFLTAFIDWCKADPIKTSKYEFNVSVDKPMQICVSIGALEQLLTICADTSLIENSNDHSTKPFYDFRAFLQQHIPKLIPIQLFDIDQSETIKLKHSIQQEKLANDEITQEIAIVYSINNDIKLSDHFIAFLVPVLSKFIDSFISTAAFMMTQLRDTEEDLLLSSETFDLETLTENADLERLYMSIFYLYCGRDEYSQRIWADTNSAAYGFLQWASRCNSPLIMATFSMLLSSLAGNNENAINVFSFLQLTNSNNSNNSDLVNSSRESSTLLTKYPSISWSTIYSTLTYYTDVLAKASDITFQNTSIEPLDLDLKSKKSFITELGEDSIIYISGFFQVLSNVARNSPQAKVELLESDNNQLFNILNTLLNMNTSLNGPILTLLSSLVGESLDERVKFWRLLDNWIFRNPKSDSFTSYPREKLNKKLINYQFVSGFVDLLTSLLKPLDSAKSMEALYTHPFPYDLGASIRKPGIWCYIEYLCLDILPEIEYTPITEKEKDLLLYSILDLMQQCLSQIDSNIILNSSACGIKDLDNIIKNETIIHYFQAHPGSAVLNSIYKNQVFDSLFKICNLGFEKLSELSNNSIKIHLLEKSMKIIEMTLSYERFLLDELVPILRLPDNPYIDPTNLGVIGLRSFTDAFLMNLQLIANFALYVGSEKFSIAKSSLIILRKTTASSTFSSSLHVQSNLTRKNLFLTTCETVDESIRIRSAFIDQFEMPITSASSMEVKLLLLQFINANISVTDNSPTISHFLLGFNTQKMTFGSADIKTTIASGRSLLKSLTDALRDIVVCLKDANNFDYMLVRFSEICLEIILKLVKSDKTGECILNYLRTSGSSNPLTEPSTNFILFLLNHNTKIGNNLLFSNMSFDGNINSENKFCSKSQGMATLTSLVSFKSILLQLIAIEIHVCVSSGFSNLTEKYFKILTAPSNFASGSSRLLSFLDVLDFKIQNNIEKINPIFDQFNYTYIFKKIQLLNKADDNKDSIFPYDLTIVDELFNLFVKDARNLRNGHVEKTKNTRLFEVEVENIKKILASSVSFDTFKTCMFNYLSSWTLLTQILVSEGNIENGRRSNLILEIFGSIIPKIDEYLELDVMFAEELVALCVHILYVYKEDKRLVFSNKEEKSTNALLDFERLFPIFKVALRGIFLPSSTPSLRSDLYVLASYYLEQEFLNTEIQVELIIFLKSIDEKIFDVICHDSLVGESSVRITSSMLLENFVKVILQLKDSHVKENIIFGTYLKENYLLLLVQKLKFTDVLFCRSLDLSESNNSISLQELLYELTSFKTNISLLIRIAQTRYGAEQLFRNDIFSIIKDCRFLQLDADLGFEIKLKEVSMKNKNNENTSLRMHISLDDPLGLKSSFVDENEDSAQNKITYYEIFIPIFQLITTIVISLGPENASCLNQAKSLEGHFSKLIGAVLKREILFEKYTQNFNEEKDAYQIDGPFSRRNVIGLKELTKLFTLLNSLV